MNIKEFLDLTTLWKHQKEGVFRAHDKDFFAYFYEMGCLSRDAEVKVSRKGGSRKYTIEELYRLFNNTELTYRQRGFDRDIPTYIRSLKEDRIGLNEIVGVYRSGEKEVYRLRTNNRYLKCTLDHKIWTKRGWVKAGDLKPGEDQIAFDFTKKHQKKPVKSNSLKIRYNLRYVGPFHPYSHIVKKTKKHRVEIHRLIFEAAMNDLDLESFIEATYSKNNLKYNDPSVYHIHHKDHNHKNNELSNLERLKRMDHYRHHGNADSIGHGKISWRKLEKIEYVGKEMTYDIECKAPYHSFVANDMVVHNSGKTATTITLLRWWFMQERGLRDTLILCPPVVIRQWKEEFKHWSKMAPFVVCLDGPGSKRVKLLKENDKPKIYITNYESLTVVKGFYEEIMKKNLFALVCDECHKLKSPNAKRTKRAIDLGDMAQKRVMLSGTPVLNSPMDLFSQYRVMDRGLNFGKNFFVFRAMYFYDINEKRKGSQGYFPMFKPRKGIEKDFNDILARTAMRVEKSECLDLPPLVKKEIFVEMSQKQKKVYEEMKKDFVAYLEDNSAAVASMALVKSLRLQQIVTGFATTEDLDGKTKETEIPGKNPRLEALEEILQEIGEKHKIIVWAAFKYNYKGIANVCKKLKIGYTELHGGVSAKDRGENIEKFKTDPECRVIIANQKAGGVGLNLTESSYSIYYSRTYSLEDDLQSEARNYRGGSDVHESVTRIDLVTPGTIDQIILSALRKKLNIAENILDIRKQLT